MAYQPPPSTPIPWPPSKHPRRSTHHHTLNPRSPLSLHHRSSIPSPLPSRRRNRGHAPRPVHDRQIPYRPTIPLQSSPHPFLINRRRPRPDPKRPEKCNGLAYYTGYIPEDEELHSYWVRFLLAVRPPPFLSFYTLTYNSIPIQPTQLTKQPRFFGQILLFYCISHSPHSRLRETLPPGWERWNEEMLQFLEDCAPYSPAVAKDLELLRMLWSTFLRIAGTHLDCIFILFMYYY